MKITRKQIRKILLEYEQHVYTDDDGVTWLVDDEGNREQKSKKFGQQWGGESGETYTGTRMPWVSSERGDMGSRMVRPRVRERPQWIVDQIMAIEASIKLKPNKFLTSVLSQIKRSKGRGLSDKQNNIVKKILAKTNPDSASLFEGNKMKVTRRQLKRIIKEEKRKLLNEQASDTIYSATVAIHQRLNKIMKDVLETLSVEELETLATTEVTGPGGWDEATQALAKIALSQLGDGGHYRGS